MASLQEWQETIRANGAAQIRGMHNRPVRQADTFSWESWAEASLTHDGPRVHAHVSFVKIGK